MRCRGAWRLRATILAATAALLLAGCAEGRHGTPVGSAAADPIPAAQAKIFVPVTAGATRTVSGDCWTGSITVGAAGAYRCFAGKKILDPCFAASATARHVVCYVDPWTPGVLVALTKPLPRTTPLIITHPWALELTNGKRCVAVTGVVPRVGGVPQLYRCHGGGSTGAPAPAAGHTDVRYVAPGSSRPVTMPVSVIWQA